MIRVKPCCNPGFQARDIYGDPVDNPKLALIEAVCISYFTIGTYSAQYYTSTSIAINRERDAERLTEKQTNRHKTGRRTGRQPKRTRKDGKDKRKI